MCLLVWLVAGSSAVSNLLVAGCLQFTCLLSLQFICLPVWLVVSGSLAVCLHLSPSCVPLVSQMSPGWVSQMWFPRRCLPGARRFLRLLSSCLSLVLEGVVSQLSSNCLPQFPFVSQNRSAHCLQASSISRPVVSQSSFKMLFPTPSCFAFVLQMWSSNCLGFCSRCALLILSQLSSTQPPHHPVLCSQ